MFSSCILLAISFNLDASVDADLCITPKNPEQEKAIKRARMTREHCDMNVMTREKKITKKSNGKYDML
jgi:hypothetical protein